MSKAEGNNYFDDILEREDGNPEQNMRKNENFTTEVEGRYYKISKVSPSVILQNENDEKIAKEITKKRESFIDASFLLNDPKNYEDTFSQTGARFDLFRPSDFLTGSQIKLFNECKLHSFYEIGDLSQDHIIDVLSALTTQPDLIKRLFKQDKSSGLGLYQISVNSDGKWTQILVDDQIAMNCSNESSLGLKPLNRFDDSEPDLWAFLLEKAYAKLLGGYHKLGKVSLVDCLRDLTGSPCKVLNIKDTLYENTRRGVRIRESSGGVRGRGTNSTFGRLSQSINPAIDIMLGGKERDTWDNSLGGIENLFSQIKSGLKNGHLVLAANLSYTGRGSLALFKGSRIFQKRNEIEKGRAYTILSIFESGKGLRLIKMMVPMGVEQIYKGDWARGSRNWKTYPELERKVYGEEGEEEEEENTFWLSLEEVMDKFQDIVVSEVEPGMHQNSLILKEYMNEVNRGMTIGIVKMKVWKDGFFHINLTQGKNSHAVLNQLELTLVQISRNPGDCEIYQKNLFRFVEHDEGVKKTLTISAKLPFGEYVGLIRSYLHPKIINTKLRSPALVLSSYGYSTNSLAFLQTSVSEALPPLFGTMNEMAWRSFINESENLLTRSLITSKYPSKMNQSEFYIDVPSDDENGDKALVEIENILLEKMDVNLFRFRLDGAKRDGYLEAEISYNSNFFVFEGGEIYESEILDLEQYNDDVETILVRTPRLDEDNSAVVLLKRKFHSVVIMEELGDKFQLEIKDVQFVPFDPEGTNDLLMRSHNVEIMLSESKLVREQSQIETVFESAPVKNKGYLQSKDPAKNFEFLENCLANLARNVNLFMLENQLDDTSIVTKVNKERLSQIQEILGLEVNCWVKLLERISLSLINVSVENLRKSFTGQSNFSKIRHMNIMEISHKAKIVNKVKEKLRQKCVEFKMKNLNKKIKENWILNEVEALSNTDMFVSPEPSAYKRVNNLQESNKESIKFRLEGSKGSFFGGIISELKIQTDKKQSRGGTSDSSSFFNSTEKRTTERLLSFGKRGLATGRVESERSVRANFLHNHILAIPKISVSRRDIGDSNISKQIAFTDDNRISDYYKQGEDPMDFFKDFKDSTDSNGKIMNLGSSERKPSKRQTFPVRGNSSDKKGYINSETDFNSPNFTVERVLDAETPDPAGRESPQHQPRVSDPEFEDLSGSYHMMIQKRLSEKNKESPAKFNKDQQIVIVDQQSSENKPNRPEMDDIFHNNIATKTEPIESKPVLKTIPRKQITTNLTKMEPDQRKRIYAKMKRDFLGKKSSPWGAIEHADGIKPTSSSTEKRKLISISQTKKKTEMTHSTEDKNNTPEYLKNLRMKQTAEIMNQSKSKDFLKNERKKLNFSDLDEEEKEKLDIIVDSFKRVNKPMYDNGENAHERRLKKVRKRLNYHTTEQAPRVKYTGMATKRHRPPLNPNLMKRYGNIMKSRGDSSSKKALNMNKGALLYKPNGKKYHFNTKPSNWLQKKANSRRSNSTASKVIKDGSKGPVIFDPSALTGNIFRSYSRPKITNKTPVRKQMPLKTHRPSKSFQLLPKNPAVISQNTPKIARTRTPSFSHQRRVVLGSHATLGSITTLRRRQRNSSNMQVGRGFISPPMHPGVMFRTMRRSVGNAGSGTLFSRF